MIFSVNRKVVVICAMFLLMPLLVSAQKNTDWNVALESVEGKEKVDLLLEISKYYSNSNAKLSVSYTEQAIAIAQQLDYDKGLQQGFYYMAIAQYYLYNYDTALVYYRKAINYVDISKSPFELVKIYNNIGAVYDVIDENSRSIEYYKKNLELLKKYKDDEKLATTNINIAIVYTELDNYDSAMYFLKESYQLASKANFKDKSMKAHIKANMAETYFKMGDYEKALATAKETLNEQDEYPSTYVQVSVHLIIGRIYYSMGMYAKSANALSVSIDLATQLGSPQREMTARKYLSNTYKKWGKTELALAEFEAYDKVKDSVLIADKDRQIQRVEDKYESEKQKKEIELLKKETALAESNLASLKLRRYFFAVISIIGVFIFVYVYASYRYKNKSNQELETINKNLAASESRLIELNAMKDNLIRIIGHDLKGPLNSVMGFSELLTIGKFSEQAPKARKFKEIIFNTSMGINQLLDNILYWARLQRGGYSVNKEDFNVYEVVVQAIIPYRGVAENKNIDILIDIDEEIVAYGDKFTCNIIIGNLVNNALKYSHPDSKVDVKVKPVNNMICFSVIDYGVGIDEESCSLLFNKNVFNSTLGTNNEKGTGFGLKICKQFIDLNEGELWVDSEPGKGSKFRFSFPSGNRLKAVG